MYEKQKGHLTYGKGLTKKDFILKPSQMYHLQQKWELNQGRK